MTSLLRVDSVSKSFGGVTACSSVTLEINRNELVGVVGQNGAGKTTLFDCIAGTLPIDEGSIWLDGRRIDRLSADGRCRHGVARTFQNLRPFANMTVAENVIVGGLCRTWNASAARREASDWIGYVGLEKKADAPAGTLSTGQRKRLELARALATQPTLLLLDEVTGGVDPASLPGLLDLVRRLKSDGMTLLVVEHNMSVIRALADRLVAMHLGVVISSGPPEHVLTDPIVVEAYLGEAYLEQGQA